MPIIVSGGMSAGSLITGITYCSVDDIIRQIRRELQDNPFMDTLSAAITTTSATSISFTTPARWAQSARVEFDDASGEVAWITAGTAGSNPFTILRAREETTAAVHGNGAVVLKNPRFTYDRCSQAIQRTIEELWPWAWAAATQTLTFDSTKNVYALNVDFIDVIDLVQQVTGTITDVTRLSNAAYEVEFHVPTAVSATGMGLRILNWDNTTNTMLLTYRAKLGTSNIECGLMSDVVAWGAKWRLLGAKDIPRSADNVSQGDATSPPGTLIRDATWAFQQYMSAQGRLQLELEQRHPPRKKYHGSRVAAGRI